MKAYKVEILIIDFNRIGATEIKNELESANYANDCIMPHVMSVKSADIGEWSDDHLLNGNKTMADEYNKLFFT